MADSGHWQERARRIEDKLSDALHERLIQRFVDRRAATLVRRLRAGGDLLAAIKPGGEVVVEGEFVGRLEGFNFRLDGTVEGEDAKPLLTAARRVLSGQPGLWRKEPAARTRKRGGESITSAEPIGTEPSARAGVPSGGFNRSNHNRICVPLVP